MSRATAPCTNQRTAGPTPIRRPTHGPKSPLQTPSAFLLLVLLLLTLKEAVAQVSASMRFWRASLRGLDRGSWLPVMTMGFLKPEGGMAMAAGHAATMLTTCAHMSKLATRK